MEDYKRFDVQTTRKAKAYYAKAVAEATKSPLKTYDGMSLEHWRKMYEWAESQLNAEESYNKSIAAKRSSAGQAENERSKAKDRAVNVRNQYYDKEVAATLYENSTRGKINKNLSTAKTKIKDLAKSYQDTYNTGMDMVMNFLKRK